MSEYEVQTSFIVEGCRDYDVEVTAIYEVEGSHNLSVTGVYIDNDPSEQDIQALLTKAEADHVHQACINDYEYRCSRAEALQESYEESKAEWLSERER